MKLESSVFFHNLSHEFKELMGCDKLINNIGRYEEIASLVSELDYCLQENEQAAYAMMRDMLMEDDYYLLIPAGGKHTWCSTVKLIEAVGYPQNKKALPSLLLLLQDLNWPDAKEGMHVLKSAGKEAVMPLLEAAIKSAAAFGDTVWLAWIKHFMEFAHICEGDFANHDAFTLLQYAEW